jgi:hypothetical protein
MDANSFAKALDRAIARSDRATDRFETNLDQLTARLSTEVTQPNQKFD